MDKWVRMCVLRWEVEEWKKKGGGGVVLVMVQRYSSMNSVVMCVLRQEKKRRVLMSKYRLQADFFCQPSGRGQAQVGISGQLQYSKVNILFTEVMKLDHTGIVNKMGRDLAHRPTDATLTTVWPQRRIWYFGFKKIQLFSVYVCVTIHAFNHMDRPVWIIMTPRATSPQHHAMKTNDNSYPLCTFAD